MKWALHQQCRVRQQLFRVSFFSRKVVIKKSQYFWAAKNGKIKEDGKKASNDNVVSLKFEKIKHFLQSNQNNYIYLKNRY